MRAAVVGVAGERLDPFERDLFRRLPPAGFILFRRNLADPAQLAALVAELKALFPGRWVPVLVDQEGGRVQRLRPPAWTGWPSAAALARTADPEALTLRAAFGLGSDLAAHGIDVDCAPVLDLAVPGATPAIGDRAFAADPARVARLGGAFARGLALAGVAPVMKHLPGHGRASADSHLELPVVDASIADLRATDWLPFRALANAVPFAMTAHVLYEALDPRRPATLSPTVIGDIVRGEIGFAGILLSDDLDMHALQGPVPERAAAAIDAGCDLALQCGGDAAVAAAVLAAVPPLPAARLDRLQAARPAIPPTAQPGLLLARAREIAAEVGAHLA
ncbi:MAG: beta-N-acetylhexosaminidase [Geminicoccaceae bacterium]|nr:beta-N-acetylhexosaminidase [Geminicoccaceae bacterium]